jgi:Concanavalin A-like lectin/glucanases superfamily
MSLTHNPSIVTNGLISYFDMYNTRKSFQGTPTTNLIINGDFSQGLTNYITYVGTPTIVTVSDTPVQYGVSRNVLKIQSSSTLGGGGTAGGINWPSITSVADIGSTYSISFYLKLLKQSEYTHNTMFEFSNQNGLGEQNSLTFDFYPTYQWNRYSHTAVLDLYRTQMFIYNYTTNTDYLISDIQIEKQPFATPFVSSTRTATQSVLDLTKNYTFTSTNIVYNNNTFSFDGTSSYITAYGIPDSLWNNSSWTVCAWANFSQTNRGIVNTNDNAILSHGNANTDQAIHLLERLGYIYFGFYSDDFKGTTFLSSSTWYHLTWSYDITNHSRYCYINGQPETLVVAATGGNGIYTGTGSNTTIGWYLLNSSHMYGTISSLAIYNRALSADEISRNFNAHRGRYGL